MLRVPHSSRWDPRGRVSEAPPSRQTPAPPHPHGPGSRPPLPPSLAPHNAQCTGAGAPRAAPEPREPATRPSPASPLRPLPVSAHPTFGLHSNGLPRRRRPRPANKSMCLCLRLRSRSPARGHPPGPASRAGLQSSPPARRPNADPGGTRCCSPSLPAPRDPAEGRRAPSPCVPTRPHARSHLPLPPASGPSVASLSSAAPGPEPGCAGGGPRPPGQSPELGEDWSVGPGVRPGPPGPGRPARAE